ncbi:sugar phosphate isomerase/epimerase [Halobacteriales archaeon QH_7_68_42]|nr:MAG: sugar phosphate isomerase/epimerase [Halobacteriales archaeon QH_7_68_42]
MKVGIQPFTISELDEPLEAKLDRIARAGFEGVELGTDGNTDAVHEKLIEHGLEVSSIGTTPDELENDLDAHVAAAEDFDTGDVVAMWIDPEHFETRERVEATAERLTDLADRVAEHGLQLNYHNHAHEFTDLGETTGYELLVEEAEGVKFELDAGWAGTGGATPAALLRDIAGHVTLVHVKDMNFETGEFVTFGEGDLDVEGVVSAARDADVEWLLFENDEPTDPVAEPAHASVTLDRYTDHYC